MVKVVDTKGSVDEAQQGLQFCANSIYSARDFLPRHEDSEALNGFTGF